MLSPTWATAATFPWTTQAVHVVPHSMGKSPCSSRHRTHGSAMHMDCGMAGRVASRVVCVIQCEREEESVESRQCLIGDEPWSCNRNPCWPSSSACTSLICSIPAWVRVVCVLKGGGGLSLPAKDHFDSYPAV